MYSHSNLNIHMENISKKHVAIFIAMILVFVATYMTLLSSDTLVGSITNRTTAYEQDFCRPSGTRQEVCIPGSIPAGSVFVTSSQKLTQTPSSENNYTSCMVLTESDSECSSVILEAKD